MAPEFDDDQKDDSALFRDAVGPLKRLPESPPPPQRSRPRPAARMAERDEIEALGEFQRGLDDLSALAAGDTLSYRHASLPATKFQRLRKGRFSVQDELDLHGATAVQAQRLIRQFLSEASAHELGCVRIIHGKGLRDEGRLPVLKNIVDTMLRQRSDVVGFHSAPAAQGGTGAVIVLLARR